MIKTFEIDFVRATFDNAFGNIEEYRFASFYEPLRDIKDITTYHELYTDIVEELNQTHYKGIGVVSTTSSPSITSIKNAFISPFEFNVSLRTKVAHRDSTIRKTYEVIEKLKGRKSEFAQLESSEGEIVDIIKLGVLWQEGSELQDHDFVGEWTIGDMGDYLSQVLTSKGITYADNQEYILYVLDTEHQKLVCVSGKFDNGDFIFGEVPITEHDKVELYKLDLSFDSLRVDTPQTLNGEDFITISLSGSATLVSRSVMLGNDLVQLGIKENSETATFTYLEPMDIPNDYKPDIFSYGLSANGFKGSEHIQAYSSNISYTFILDTSIELIYDIYKQTRYLTNETPNKQYKVVEITSSFGVVELNEYIGKMTNNIQVDKNDTDVMSITIPFSVVGESE